MVRKTKISQNIKKKSSNSSKIPFEKRENLEELLKKEKSFKLQVYSFESVEIFEEYLKSIGLAYTKTFTSSQIPKRTIALLLDDGGVVTEGNRIILYSNSRNFSFVPCRFILSSKEKEAIVKDRAKIEANKSAPATALLAPALDVEGYVASCLNYVQSVIVMCLLKENTLKGICREAGQIDVELENSFIIKCELNWLCKHKICIKTGEKYRIGICQENVQRICENIGFGKIFQ